MLKYLSLLPTIAILYLSGCSRIYHKSEMSLLEEPFNRDSITFRTDGYYYTEIAVETYEYSDPQTIKTKKPELFLAKGMKPIIFYNDGFVKKDESMWLESKPSNSASKKRIDSLLVAYENSGQRGKVQYKRTSKANLWDWGIYRQNNTHLELQYYINHFGQYRLVTLKVSVLNDSTLLTTHKYSSYAGVQPHVIDDSLNEVYKFRKFSPKLDSVNYLRDNLHKFGKKKR